MTTNEKDRRESAARITLLTVKEAAAKYNVDRSTLYKRIHSPEYASFVTRVGGLRIIQERFEEWLERGGEKSAERSAQKGSSAAATRRGTPDQAPQGAPSETPKSSPTAGSPKRSSWLTLRTIHSRPRKKP